MTQPRKKGSFKNVARVLVNLGDQDQRCLDRMKADLLAGRDGDALARLRKFLGLGKLPDRESETIYDRGNGVFKARA